MPATRFNPAPTAPLPLDVRAMQASANALFVLVAVALVLAAFAWLVRLPVFTIRGVKVEGDLTRNSVATIRANAMPGLAGSFFTMDLQRARAAFESVPWVRRAVVSRVWPNRLQVRLEEHRPAALWAAEDGNDRLVNTHGEVFEANVGDVEDDGLPTLAGPEGSAPQMLALVQRLAPVLAPLGGDLQRLELSHRGSWRAELDNGATVELGRGSAAELLARADRFVRSLPQVTARYQRPLLYADLRHADGYAVRLKGITTLAPATPAAKR